MAVAGGDGGTLSNRAKIVNGELVFLAITNIKPRELIPDVEEAATLLLAGQSSNVDVRHEYMTELRKRLPNEREASMKTFPELVAAELEAARAEHPPVPSLHHYHGVLLEELNEFAAEVAKKPAYRCKARLLAELVQVSTVAQRAAEDLELLP